MNLLKPISSIMSTRLFTVHPLDTVAEVKALFDKHAIHHLPVVRYREIVGIISRSDLLYFLDGYNNSKSMGKKDDSRLAECKVEELMTTGLAKVNASDPLRTAVEVFKLNRFHAMPVLDDNNELVGIITTHDLINALSETPIRLEDYQNIK